MNEKNLSPENIFALLHEKDTVLIIEDDEINRGILGTFLQGKFNILEAENGKVGLDILDANYDKVSIILLDLLMPVMDGYEFLQRMGNDKRFNAIPVITLTSSTADPDQIRALKLGASDFISKPYNPHIIVNRIKAMVRLRRSFNMLSAAAVDKLTGVYSSQFFFTYAEQILKTHPNTDYDFICTNIESFKVVNTRHGRKIGDKFLQEISGIFQSILQEHEICGRMNADRFAILLQHRERDVYQNIENEIVKKLKSVGINSLVIKFGIYENVKHDESTSSMYDSAMLALNSITKQYGETIRYFDKTLQDKAQNEQNIIDNMEEALATNEFVVYYQPKHGIEENKAMGAEALVRWNSKKFGFMNPGLFIPLFEQNGFIAKLDYYIWESVCKMLRERLDANARVVPISVNISRSDFDMADLDQKIIALADKYNVPHDLLHLELTESAYNDNPEQIRKIIESLHSAGFVIELDDFGTGYSSLSVLTKMQFDILKLDMSLIREIKTPAGRNILSCIVDLAHRFNMKTVAEGCEDQETADILGELGCTYIQGYFYSKPLPPKEFFEYIELHR
ncbi:MAG: EAL domain-containing protein [Treponemataceae bacterium]|nr:EAL domain-containing protein [Treponemataceae bacterium]